MNSEQNEPEVLTGRCECGNVRFEISGEIQELSHCHCSQCRRLHGAAFASFATVNRNAFRYLPGKDTITRYNSSTATTRVFCSQCGSAILADVEEDEAWLYIAMSTFLDDPVHPPAYHEFVGSKAAWYEILDDGGQYDKGVT